MEDAIKENDESLSALSASGAKVGNCYIYRIPSGSEDAVTISTNNGSTNPFVLYISNGNIMQVARSCILLLGRSSNYQLVGGSGLTITYEQGESTNYNTWTISPQSYAEGIIISQDSLTITRN